MSFGRKTNLIPKVFKISTERFFSKPHCIFGTPSLGLRETLIHVRPLIHNSIVNNTVFPIYHCPRYTFNIVPDAYNDRLLGKLPNPLLGYSVSSRCGMSPLTIGFWFNADVGLLKIEKCLQNSRRDDWKRLWSSQKGVILDERKRSFATQ